MTSTKRDYGTYGMRKRAKTWTATIRFGLDPITGKEIRRYTTGKNKKEARAKADAIVREYEQGYDVTTDKMSLRAYLPEWLLAYAKKRKLEEPTVTNYERYCRQIVGEGKDGHAGLGNVPVHDLRSHHLDQLFTVVGRSEGVAIENFKMLRMATRKFFIDKRSPFNGYLLPVLGAPTEQRSLAAYEITAEMEAAKDTSMEPIAGFLLTTGTRVSEMCALDWPNVDLRNGWVHINKSIYYARKTRQWKAKPPKNKQNRGFDISAATVGVLADQFEAVQRQKENAPVWDDSLDLVFPNSIGGYMDRNNMRKGKLYPLCDRAGVDRHGWHVYRHTHISLALAAGEEPFYISRRVGHSKVAITTDTYGHTMQDRGQIAAHVADKFLPPPRA